MVNLLLGLERQLTECLIGALEFVITLEILHTIFMCSQILLKGYGYHLVGVIVKCLKALGTFRYIIAVGIEKFTVYAVLFTLFCVRKLLKLKVIFLVVPLKSSVYNLP